MILLFKLIDLTRILTYNNKSVLNFILFYFFDIFYTLCEVRII